MIFGAILKSAEKSSKAMHLNQSIEEGKRRHVTDPEQIRSDNKDMTNWQ